MHSPIEGVEGGLRAPTAETTVAPHIDNQRLLPHIFYGHPHNPSTGVNVGDGRRKTWGSRLNSRLYIRAALYAGVGLEVFSLNTTGSTDLLHTHTGTSNVSQNCSPSCPTTPPARVVACTSSYGGLGGVEEEDVSQ